MSNPRFSMLNICSSLVLSFHCCFLWDSAKGGQVGLRENMLFSHTKNNHHHLITAFRNTSVSCFRVGICYCHRCAFCCSHSTKTHTKSHQFCQIGILWKVLLPVHALKGCQSFEVKFSECPDHASAEPCQGLPDGAPNSLPRPLCHPLYPGGLLISWRRGRVCSACSWGCLCALMGTHRVPSVVLCGARLPRGCSRDPVTRFRMGLLAMVIPAARILLGWATERTYQ